MTIPGRWPRQPNTKCEVHSVWLATTADDVSHYFLSKNLETVDDTAGSLLNWFKPFWFSLKTVYDVRPLAFGDNNPGLVKFACICSADIEINFNCKNSFPCVFLYETLFVQLWCLIWERGTKKMYSLIVQDLLMEHVKGRSQAQELLLSSHVSTHHVYCYSPLLKNNLLGNNNEWYFISDFA